MARTRPKPGSIAARAASGAKAAVRHLQAQHGRDRAEARSPATHSPTTGAPATGARIPSAVPSHSGLLRTRKR